MTTLAYSTPGYFQPENVRSLPTQRSALANVEVVAYTNGLWWVVPDPRDEDRAKQVEQQYQFGNYIGREVYWACPNQLPDRATALSFT